MSKSERLLELLQLLRHCQRPIKASALAEKLHVSQRTIYRDIETLRNQGADIAGEAGVGYVLLDGFLLPTLMFSIEELDALILGSHWVKSHADTALRDAAEQAMTKIQSVIPNHYPTNIHEKIFVTPLLSKQTSGEKMAFHASQVRQAIRNETILTMEYQDAKKNNSQRTIYPFLLAFFDSVQVIAAWCTLRQNFRHFRVDRINHISLSKQRYLPSRQQLHRQWQTQNEQQKECFD